MEEPLERPLALANLRYPAHAERLNQLDLAGKFRYIYQHNVWGSGESNSGIGSELDATRILRAEIPRLLAQLEAKTVLDLPCGDFGWLSHAELDVALWQAVTAWLADAWPFQRPRYDPRSGPTH